MYLYILISIICPAVALVVKYWLVTSALIAIVVIIVVIVVVFVIIVVGVFIAVVVVMARGPNDLSPVRCWDLMN